MRRSLLLLLCLALPIGACSRRPAAGGTPAGSPGEGEGRGAAPLPIEPAPLLSAPPAARSTYDERCAPCHGPSGRGDGPLSLSMTPPPRDLSDRLWQSNVSNQHLRRVILGGGGAVGKSLAMPAQPQLARDLPLVDGLVTLVRSFCAETVTSR